MTTRLNLLPWREIRRREQDRQLLTIAVGTWLLMGVVVFYAHVHVSSLIDKQNRRNQFLQQEIAKVEKQIKEIAELKKKREALIARMNVIYKLQGDRTRIVHVFDELVRRLPEGIYFQTLKETGNAISLQGIAQSNARVSALMRNLAASEWFADPELGVINVKDKGGDRVSEFSVKVKQSVKQKEKEQQKPRKRAGA